MKVNLRAGLWPSGGAARRAPDAVRSQGSESAPRRCPRPGRGGGGGSVLTFRVCEGGRLCAGLVPRVGFASFPAAGWFRGLSWVSGRLKGTEGREERRLRASPETGAREHFHAKLHQYH